jgi:hypothetical protein
MRSNDFTKIIESEVGRRRVRTIQRFCDSHGLNYMKFLCLRWQSSTGKKCTNRKHMEGEYSKKLECEAQLTESISLQVEMTGISEIYFKLMMKKLEKLT